MSEQKIPFRVETRRIIELLATQIYQSPLAMLRENIQNAYDAILMRNAEDKTDYNPQIDVSLSSTEIVIRDNGVGMSEEVIRNNFWMAGSSGKNNDSARAAGVVGTFGIGGMANFGIAGELKIETESIETGERHVSHVKVDDLELNTDCINCTQIPATGHFGTQITAVLLPGRSPDISKATNYIREFTSALSIPVHVNGVLVSEQEIGTLVTSVSRAWEHSGKAVKLSEHLKADVRVVGSQNADIWIELTQIHWAGRLLKGSMVLRNGTAHIKTFRSGFGLAPASAPSVYSFGGAVNLDNLFPTAGREALTTDSVQFLHSIMPKIDDYVSKLLAKRPECDSSTPFMQWVASRERYDLCGLLRMNLNPGGQSTLKEIVEKFRGRKANSYVGNDHAIISMYANDESPLLVFASGNPRRSCQENFLKKHIKFEPISNSPRVLKTKDDTSLSSAEGSMLFRIKVILEEDYFVKADVKFSDISHGIPVLAEKDGDSVKIYINDSAPAVGIVTGLYQQDFGAFSSLVKDFVRTNVFSKISQYVPSSTRAGAEEFLKAIRRKREIFEIDVEESDEFSSIWGQYASGEIKMSDAISKAHQTARSTVQTVDGRAAGSVAETLPDIIQQETQLRSPANAESQGTYTAEPPIRRGEIASSSKLLTIDPNEESLHGYRCFLSLTDKTRNELGEFFIEPHTTSVVWGGHRVLFIFMHHSEKYGLYYDIQTSTAIGSGASGSSFPTCTLVLKNRIYIPIPDQISAQFIPDQNEKRRFEIRFDLIRSDAE